MQTVPKPLIDFARRLAYAVRHKVKRGTRVPYGWKRLGCGHFSQVFEHEDWPGYVVKISSRGQALKRGGECLESWVLRDPDDTPASDAWQEFAQYCQHHPSPHLPAILHYEQMHKGTAWAIMPRYYPAEDFDHDNTRERWEEQLEGLAPLTDEWLRPIKWLAETNNYYVDLNSYNVMVDSSGRLIMTDPFSCSRGTLT